jgi:hypothetical protein
MISTGRGPRRLAPSIGERGGGAAVVAKGRDSRIFQAQDRAIDDFTLKGICAGNHLK